jgi:hypothetical protein
MLFYLTTGRSSPSTPAAERAARVKQVNSTISTATQINNACLGEGSTGQAGQQHH